jgi:hypothetical protein
MVGFERRGRLIGAVAGLMAVQRWWSVLWTRLIYLRGAWCWRAVGVDKRAQCRWWALRLKTEDGSGMVGKNFSLEGT